MKITVDKTVNIRSLGYHAQGIGGSPGTYVPQSLN